MDFEPIEQVIRDSLKTLIVTMDPAEWEMGPGILTFYTTGGISMGPFPAEMFVPNNPGVKQWLEEADNIDFSVVESMSFMIPSREVTPEKEDEGFRSSMAFEEVSKDEIEERRRKGVPCLMVLSMNRDGEFQIHKGTFYLMKGEPILLGELELIDLGDDNPFFQMPVVKGMFDRLND